MIRITLIIATFNRSLQLMKTLHSVARQDLPAAEWECVVVNNRCTDNTAERFEAFAAAHPGLQLRMVEEWEAGLSHARNCGLARAAGELVAFIDDDEWIEPQFLRSYVDFFDRHPDVLAAGGPVVAEYPEGRPAWLSKYPEQAIANAMDFGPKVRPFPRSRIPAGGNMAFRRAFFGTGGFNTRFGRVGKQLTGGEESELFERLRLQGFEAWYVPGAAMHHVIPGAKLTEGFFRNLCFHMGLDQQRRARLRRRLPEARGRELLKWVAALLLCCTLRPVQSRWLLRMRREISRGLFAAAD